jgi:hypothetical protein
VAFALIHNHSQDDPTSTPPTSLLPSMSLPIIAPPPLCTCRSRPFRLTFSFDPLFLAGLCSFAFLFRINLVLDSSWAWLLDNKDRGQKQNSCSFLLCLSLMAKVGDGMIHFSNSKVVIKSPPLEVFCWDLWRWTRMSSSPQFKRWMIAWYIAS